MDGKFLQIFSLFTAKLILFFPVLRLSNEDVKTMISRDFEVIKADFFFFLFYIYVRDSIYLAPISISFQITALEKRM